MDLAERRGADIAVRQPKVCMVQEVEQLAAELQFFIFGDTNVLESREVPVCVSRSLKNVAAFIAELLHWRVYILRNSLESGGIEPFLRRARSGVRVADEVRPVAGKTRN